MLASYVPSLLFSTTTPFLGGYEGFIARSQLDDCASRFTRGPFYPRWRGADLQWRMERRFFQKLQFRSCRSITRRRSTTSITENEGGNEADLLRYGVCLFSSILSVFLLTFSHVIVSISVSRSTEGTEETMEDNNNSVN